MVYTLIRQDPYTKGFIGSHEDTKPTQASSSLTEGINNGDTFFEADTGKTFIFYEGTWYDMSNGEADSP